MPMQVSAAKINETQKKVADTTDYFIKMVLTETQWKVRSVYPGESNVLKKQFLKQLKKVYSGKLTSRQKAVIATSQIDVTEWTMPDELSPYALGTKSLSKVKKEYKKLFGTKNPSIKLPVLKKIEKVDQYYMMYGKKGSKVYALSMDTEDDFSSSYVGVKKKGSTYTVTKKYKYYSHWSLKENGKKPTQTITVKIKLKKKSSSSYKYNVVGITFS